MKYLTPEQIAAVADNYIGSYNRTVIRKLFKAQDESHLYPINGRFNATVHAIRRLRDQESLGCDFGHGLEYALALDAEISAIVNEDV